MEDNYTDDKTVDAAWDAMREVLDKEMPVAERSRRMGFWFFASIGALVILIGTGIYQFWSTDTVLPIQNKEQEVKQVEKKIASVSDSPNSQRGNSKKEIQTQEEKLQLENKKIDTNIKSVITNKNSHKKVNTSSLLTTKVSSSEVMKSKFKRGAAQPLLNTQAILLEKDLRAKQYETKPIEKQSLSTQQEVVLEANELSVTRNEVVGQKRAPDLKVAPISLLPLHEVQSLYATNEEHIDRIDVAEFKKQDWAIRWYGMQHLGQEIPTLEFTSEGKSWGLEILHSKAIGSKWRAGMGIGYKCIGESFFETNSLRWIELLSGSSAFDPTISPDFDPSELSDFESASGIISVKPNLPEGNIAGSLSGIEIESVIFNLRKTQFISLPFFVERKFAGRWSLEGGGRYNQKIGNFDTGFFKNIRKSTVDIYLTPNYSLSKVWSVGLALQYSTRQFKQADNFGIDEFGRFQLGISTKIRI